MIKNLQRWLVRRWLHLIPYPELEAFAKHRRMYAELNTAYKKVCDDMIETYFTEGK